MAQKNKAAAKPARGEGQSGKKSKVKPSAKAVKPKTVVKPARALKALSPKVAATAVEPSVEAQIGKAKAALKKETVASAPKATSAKARARKISIEISANEAASALAQKWSTLYKKSEQIESKPYNMRAQFEEKTAIMHKVLGWGYILANRNDRLEVLFKDGIKYLISNYKP